MMSRHRTIATLVALCSTLVGAPALAAEDSPRLLIVDVPPPAPGPSLFDNFRLGMASFQDRATSALFGGGNAAAFGFDYPIGGGLAIGVDSFNLYKDYGTVNYLLSINPVQLRYRLGLPTPASFLEPFATAGAGLSLMGLMGGPSGSGQFGMGPAASGGIGMSIHDAFTVELGVNGGKVAQIGYYGWQLRAGTTFQSLGDLKWLGLGKPAVARVAPRPAALSGLVRDVAGNRLVLTLAPGTAHRPGDEVLVYYKEDIEVKVARAKLVTVEPNGGAIAEVVVATEAVKPGYRIRAW
jgi:hypothetical protein